MLEFPWLAFDFAIVLVPFWVLVGFAMSWVPFNCLWNLRLLVSPSIAR